VIEERMDEPALAPSYRCYAVERIVFSLIVLWLGLTFIFVMFWVVPEDPGVLFAGKGADAGTVEASRKYLHLDQSLVDQYGMFLGRIVRGDLGYSWYNRESVGGIVRNAVPVTASLVGGALTLALLFAVPLGLVWGRSRTGGRYWGGPLRAFSYLGVSLWSVWTALILLRLLTLGHVFEVVGYREFFNPPPGAPGGPLEWAYGLVLPWICLALAPAAIYLRIMRQSVAEERADPQSMSRPKVVAVMTKLVTLDIAWLFGATVLIEALFALPGLGYTTIQALQNFDLPTMVGIFVAVLFIQVAVTLIADLVGAALSKNWPRGYPPPSRARS
jgi:peptide/nickel transport system permease protein